MNEFLALLAQYVPVLGPPIAIAVVWIYTEARKKKKEDSKDVLERERTYADRLEGRLKERESDVERLSKEIMTLRTTDDVDPEQVLRDLIDNDPGLSWVKRRYGPRDYKMVRVSRGYAKALLKGAPEQYDGKRDSDIWPFELANRFAENDEAVYVNQEGIHMEEVLPNGKFIGRKFPIHQRGTDYVVGIGNYEPFST